MNNMNTNNPLNTSQASAQSAQQQQRQQQQRPSLPNNAMPNNGMGTPQHQQPQIMLPPGAMADNRYLNQALANQMPGIGMPPGMASNQMTPGSGQSGSSTPTTLNGFILNSAVKGQNIAGLSPQFQMQQANFISQMLQNRMKQHEIQQMSFGGNQIPNFMPQGPAHPQQQQQQQQQQHQLIRGNSLQPGQQHYLIQGGGAGLPPMAPSPQPQHQPLLQSQSSQPNDNFKVVIRVRPPLPREMKDDMEFRGIVQVQPDHKSCSILEYLGAEVAESEKQRDMDANPHLCVWQTFTFDHVYDMNSTQENVYENTAKQAVWSVLEGYNATILAYGQTGTGKTYTMEGFKYSAGDPQRGIVPRSMEEIFRFIQMQSSQNSTFMVRASYLQIYNEVISDLLKIDRTSLQIREDKKKGVFVEGLSEWAVRSPNEIYSLMQKGALSRATATTKMNDMSSRSHAVFIIIVEQMTTMPANQSEHHNQANANNYVDDDAPKQIKVGKLNLVDLAGSERVRVTGATGKRLEESKKINQSLSCLGNVIAALTDQRPRAHIPYRDSKLTRLLEDSLGGNCKTTMMAMISPSSEGFGESISTLKFATRAKKIKNEARINEDVDQRALLRKYEVELRKLKLELNEKNRHINSHSHLLQLEEEKRRAEQDKAAAINALEERNREYIMERDEKKRLEEKIRALNSQMLIGGKKIEETPQFRSLLEEKQKLIRQEYELKLQEMERERTQIEEEKAQVDRYKQLLLKQRDIMIALTSRLNERDETIIQLQEELDAYDRIHKDTEQIIDQKVFRVQQLEEFIREVCKMEPPSPTHSSSNNGGVTPGGGAYSDQGMDPFNQVMALSNQQHHHRGEKVYPAISLSEENGFGQQQAVMLNADEKINELTSLLEMQEQENDQLREQIEATGSASNSAYKETTNYESEHLKGQIELNQQEKQAYFMISNDIQNLIASALQDVVGVSQTAVENKQALMLGHQSHQKLSEVSKLVASLQKHLSQGLPNTGGSALQATQANKQGHTNMSRPSSSFTHGMENVNPHQLQQQQVKKSGGQIQQQAIQGAGAASPYQQQQQKSQNGTPRSGGITQLPPRHLSQNSGGGGSSNNVSQQVMTLGERPGSATQQASLPLNVSEMLRKRQESRKTGGQA